MYRVTVAPCHSCSHSNSVPRLRLPSVKSGLWNPYLLCGLGQVIQPLSPSVPSSVKKKGICLFVPWTSLKNQVSGRGLGSRDPMAHEGDMVYAIMELSCEESGVKNHIYVNIIAATAMSVVKEANHELRWRMTGSQGGRP